jgi:hypothetical protein
MRLTEDTGNSGKYDRRVLIRIDHDNDCDGIAYPTEVAHSYASDSEEPCRSLKIVPIRPPPAALLMIHGNTGKPYRSFSIIPILTTSLTFYKEKANSTLVYVTTPLVTMPNSGIHVRRHASVLDLSQAYSCTVPLSLYLTPERSVDFFVNHDICNCIKHRRGPMTIASTSAQGRGPVQSC